MKQNLQNLIVVVVKTIFVSDVLKFFAQNGPWFFLKTHKKFVPSFCLTAWHSSDLQRPDRCVLHLDRRPLLCGLHWRGPARLHLCGPCHLHSFCLDPWGCWTHHFRLPRLDGFHRWGVLRVLRRLFSSTHIRWHTLAGKADPAFQ